MIEIDAQLFEAAELAVFLVPHAGETPCENPDHDHARPHEAIQVHVLSPENGIPALSPTAVAVALEGLAESIRGGSRPVPPAPEGTVLSVVEMMVEHARGAASRPPRGAEESYAHVEALASGIVDLVRFRLAGAPDPSRGFVEVDPETLGGSK
jgi:hypothetical protein